MKKTLMKRIAAAALAVVLAASLCGCDRGYLMTVDGKDIRNGVYLQLLQSAYSMAEDAYEKQIADSSDTSQAGGDSGESGSESVPITEREIEGKNGSQWIKDETLKAVRRFVAIQRKCDELGITLTEEEENEISVDVNKTWENENQYVKYLYGYETMGDYYESRGIAQESFKEISRVNELQNKLFLHFYQKGGELEVTESEIDSYLKETYCAVKYISFSYTDASGKALESDADKKAVKDKAQGYADRLNNGESPVDVFYEYNLSRVEESVKASAETEYKEDNADKLTKDEWIKKQIESANITKADTPDDLDRFITKDSTNFDSDTNDLIFKAAADGKANVIETEKAVYLIIKEDVTEKTTWKGENNVAFLTALKSDEFREMIDIFGQNYEVKLDDYLVNKKYAPEKLNENK